MVGEITSLLLFLTFLQWPKTGFWQKPWACHVVHWMGWVPKQKDVVGDCLIGIGNASFVEHNHKETTCILIPQ